MDLQLLFPTEFRSVDRKRQEKDDGYTGDVCGAGVMTQEIIINHMVNNRTSDNRYFLNPVSFLFWARMAPTS